MDSSTTPSTTSNPSNPSATANPAATSAPSSAADSSATSTNPTTRTITIDGMSGDACVKKVTEALKSVHNVTIKSVTVGSATIEADQNGCNAACASIRTAGFKARAENSGTSDHKDASNHSGNSYNNNSKDSKNASPAGSNTSADGKPAMMPNTAKNGPAPIITPTKPVAANH